MIKIKLNGLEFHGYHGVHPEEKKLGGKYIIDLHIEARVEPALTSDNLEDTVDYEALYNAIVEEMDKPCHLLEHLAKNIMTAVLKTDDRIKHGKVIIQKVNPPMKGIIRSASVEYETKK